MAERADIELLRPDTRMNNTAERAFLQAGECSIMRGVDISARGKFRKVDPRRPVNTGTEFLPYDQGPASWAQGVEFSGNDYWGNFQDKRGILIGNGPKIWLFQAGVYYGRHYEHTWGVFDSGGATASQQHVGVPEPIAWAPGVSAGEKWRGSRIKHGVYMLVTPSHPPIIIKLHDTNRVLLQDVVDGTNYSVTFRNLTLTATAMGIGLGWYDSERLLDAGGGEDEDAGVTPHVHFISGSQGTQHVTRIRQVLEQTTPDAHFLEMFLFQSAAVANDDEFQIRETPIFQARYGGVWTPQNVASGAITIAASTSGGSVADGQYIVRVVFEDIETASESGAMEAVVNVSGGGGSGRVVVTFFNDSGDTIDYPMRGLRAKFYRTATDGTVLYLEKTVNIETIKGLTGGTVDSTVELTDNDTTLSAKTLAPTTMVLGQAVPPICRYIASADGITYLAGRAYEAADRVTVRMDHDADVEWPILSGDDQIVFSDVENEDPEKFPAANILNVSNDALTGLVSVARVCIAIGVNHVYRLQRSGTTATLQTLNAMFVGTPWGDSATAYGPFAIWAAPTGVYNYNVESDKLFNIGEPIREWLEETLEAGYDVHAAINPRRGTYIIRRINTSGPGGTKYECAEYDFETQRWTFIDNLPGVAFCQSRYAESSAMQDTRLYSVDPWGGVWAEQADIQTDPYSSIVAAMQDTLNQTKYTTATQTQLTRAATNYLHNLRGAVLEWLSGANQGETDIVQYVRDNLAQITHATTGVATNTTDQISVIDIVQVDSIDTGDYSSITTQLLTRTGFFSDVRVGDLLIFGQTSATSALRGVKRMISDASDDTVEWHVVLPATPTDNDAFSIVRFLYGPDVMSAANYASTTTTKQLTNTAFENGLQFVDGSAWTDDFLYFYTGTTLANLAYAISAVAHPLLTADTVLTLVFPTGWTNTPTSPASGDGDEFVLNGIPFLIRFAPVIGKNIKNGKVLEGVHIWAIPDERFPSTSALLDVKAYRDLEDSPTFVRTDDVAIKDQAEATDEERFSPLHADGKTIEIEIENRDYDGDLRLIDVSALARDDGSWTTDRSAST